MLSKVTKFMEGFMIVMTAYLTYINWGEAAGLAWLCATSGWLAAFFRGD